jgi:hypothetical protein
MMRYRLFLTFILPFACACSCQSAMRDAQHKNRLYFSIDSLGYGIIIPLQINDSITVNLLFDTGAGADIVLDSAFVVTNELLQNTHYEKGTKDYPLGKLDNIPTLIYHTSLPVKLGETMVYYSTLEVCRIPWNRNSTVNGFFSIPRTDTTHVWELNFEDNYIEVHDADHFRMPQECIVVPVLNSAAHYLIQMPLQIVYGNDTLRSNYSYLIDTANPYSELLWISFVPEMEVLSEHEDYRMYTHAGFARWKNAPVKATVWDRLTIDTLETYFFPVSQEYGYHNIGLNFLKRFNVFFDLKNQQIGLQPIAYKRLEAAHEGTTYYFVDTTPTPDGYYRINYMPEFKKNYYQAAGLRVDDEIVLWNGHPYSDILHGKITTDAEDSVVYNIFRDGQPMQIVVHIPVDDE